METADREALMIDRIIRAASVAIIAGAMLPPLAFGQGSGDAFAGWNIHYQLPNGWRVDRSVGRLQVLVSTPDAGAIFLAPGMYSTPQEAMADLSAFYQSLNMQGFPVEQPSASTIAGLRATSATYASRNQVGQILHGRYISLLTPHGTGINFLAMAAQEKMPALRPVLEQIAASVKASPPSINHAAIAALAGSWLLYSGSSEPGTRVSTGVSQSHEETVVFDGRGSYRWQSTSQVMVNTPEAGAGRATGDNDQGTYTVIGNTLIAKGTKGQLA